MYAVRRWDEDTVIKWLAVAMCLAMVAMQVMPAVNVGDAAYGLDAFLTCWSAAHGDMVSTIGGLIGMHLELIGFALTVASGPVGAAAIAVFL
ncbi:MAG: hypothetical protein DSY33_05430 [Archaeoglobus sp.]|nr:MAG: hypothetical protein DSY33_05430 [Archaeoglobus sp.]